MNYVDGFVLAIPTANRERYAEFARASADIFLDHGALRVVECRGDDVPHGRLTDFHRAVQATADETVWIAWIEWPSKEARNAGMAKVMADPRMQPGAPPMPFDGKRVIYGGFATEIDRQHPPAVAADAAGHEIGLTRLIPVARAKLWRCWTEPALLRQWFCPPPWSVASAELDVRPGGSSRIRMQGPNGESHDDGGTYLEVVPNERLVFTDAYTRDWLPAAKPFMTGILTFADEAGGTRYTARVRHWSAADRAAHEAMGFHAGWAIATDQLAALAATL